MVEALLKNPLKNKPKEPTRVSLDVYFKREERSSHKHEYHNGIIRRMAGGTFNHDNLGTRTSTFLTIFVLQNKLNYFVNGSDTKIRIEEYDKVVYSDALVVCEKPQFFEDRKDTIINPLIIVEVLSRSTQNYDKTLKFEMYRSVPTFKEYVLVHQDRKKVSVYTKQTDNTWILKDYEGDDAIATLHILHNCPLELSLLYQGLDLETE
jgi:Uma2 family endonuclease